MTIRNLQHLFRPSSVAVIGASDRNNSVGATVMHNLLAGGFAGPVVPVNPKHDRVAGLAAVPDVESLRAAPDLAVVCTPAPTVPTIVRALGARGCKAAVVLSAGLGQKAADGVTYRQRMLEEARPHLLRILGPNCVGLLVPGIGLNASFAHTGAQPGRLAFVAQSGALTTALLDWAQTRGVGFSHFISLGDSADVDFGDVLDFLADDIGTSAILLYIESITHARKFMSAARAAARNKPVIAVKAGRSVIAAQAVVSHTGALAGADDVYDAALRRAGILRVDTTLELFDAAETLALARSFDGDRLVLLTNGGGPGVMAADALARGGTTLPELSAPVIVALDRLLPATWSRGNPVDVVGDATPERYSDALGILLNEAACDAILMIHAPTAIAPAEAVARACLSRVQSTRRCVLACWMGGASAQPARKLFADAGLPIYETPEQAVGAFLQMVRYRRTQELLIQTPSSAPAFTATGIATARAIVQSTLVAGRAMLNEVEAKEVLLACGIPTVPTQASPTVDAAAETAGRLGYPVVLKILSPDISHKSDVGGVALNLGGPQAVRDAAQAMLSAVRAARPQARLSGFVVEPMITWPDSQELIMGAMTDETFGPVVLFGAGGTGVEQINDKAVALPPLNSVLAADLVSRTRVKSMLSAHRGKPPANMKAITDMLIRVADMVSQIPEISELDLNPVIAGPQGTMVLDARIRVANAAAATAMRPYPCELEEPVTIGGRSLLLRPIRTEDESALAGLIHNCSVHDRHFRFFGAVGILPHKRLARFTQIDYDREMAFVALDADGVMLGEVRTVTDPDNNKAEFAILIASGFQGRGLGQILLKKMIVYCQRRGTRFLYGEVLASNDRMLRLADGCGFARDSAPVGGVVRVCIDLQLAEKEAA